MNAMPWTSTNSLFGGRMVCNNASILRLFTQTDTQICLQLVLNVCLGSSVPILNACVEMSQGRMGV